MAQYLRDPWNSQHIMEFLSPSFHHPTAIFFEAMLVLAVAARSANLRQGRFTEPLLMLVWAHGALLAARNIPIFMIVGGACRWRAAIHQWLLRAAGMERGRLAAHGGRASSTAWREETGETDAIAALAPGERRWAWLLVAALIWAPNPPKKFRAEFDPDVVSGGGARNAAAAIRRRAFSPTTNGATI